jgi:hypothetical protein
MTSHRTLGARRLLGAAAILFSGLYLLSDVVEAAQGGFTDAQLWLTLVAEAAIPVLVVGLWLVQRPRIGRAGAAGAVAYAVAYVLFTGSVVYALVDATPDYAALTDDLGALMTIPGVVMVLGGLAFGAATSRAGVLPPWTGVTLAAGVVLVAATQGAPEGVQVLATAVRDVAFAGMGAALLAGQPLPVARAGA